MIGSIVGWVFSTTIGRYLVGGVVGALVLTAGWNYVKAGVAERRAEKLAVEAADLRTENFYLKKVTQIKEIGDADKAEIEEARSSGDPRRLDDVLRKLRDRAKAHQ